MSLMCTLGLATCITVNGTSFTQNDFNDIVYECSMAQSYGYYEEVTFILLDGDFRIGLQDGYTTLDLLEERGVEFRWTPDGGAETQAQLAKFRKRQLMLACAPFINFR